MFIFKKKMGEVRLRCKYEQGQKVIPDVKTTTTIAELLDKIEAISGKGSFLWKDKTSHLGMSRFLEVFPWSILQLLKNYLWRIFHAPEMNLLNSIPAASQSIRYGYPPKKMEMGQKTLTLSETGLKSGETLIVEGKSLENWPAVVETKPEPPRPVVEPGIR